MNICGVIAEYNPFHNGHALQIAKTREILGEDCAIVAVMSGNFVQRGEFAVAEKYFRAKLAVQNGVDLVIELPLVASLSSAEGFALGAVSLLEGLGCVTHLSFGSECGDLAQIQQAVELQQSEGYQQALQSALQQGKSYAAAHAVASQNKLLDAPNNTLGIAYCTALAQLQSTIQPLTIQRQGTAHDAQLGTGDSTLPSASQLRTLLYRGALRDCACGVSAYSLEQLHIEYARGSLPAHSDRCNQAMVSYLRRLSAEQLQVYCGGKDGFGARLVSAIARSADYNEICHAAQTSRYPLARVRRALMRAYLDLPLQDCTATYGRVLAVGARGAQVLKLCKSTAKIPIFTKAVTEKKNQALQLQLQQDVRAGELYAFAQPCGATRAGEHYRCSPYVLSKETQVSQTSERVAYEKMGLHYQW